MLRRLVGARGGLIAALARGDGIYALAFVLTAACLIAVMSPLILSSGADAGDFAANSLLIQQAKHLTLLVGPFSRAMFPHPGPALLYVQAAGEALFYDGLHIVPSPVAGHLVAVALSEAAWLTATGWLFARLSGDRMTAFVFTAVYALFASSVDHAVIGGLWLPHMYVTPFGCLMVASAALLRGDRAAFLPFAIAWGYLFNGHISFAAICGIVFAVTAVGHVVLSRLGADRRWGSSFHRLSLREIIGGCATLAVVMAAFSLPLLIRTLREPVSPIAGYIAFSRANTRHGMGEALGYIVQYWGSSPWQWGLVVLCLASLSFAARRSIVALTILVSTAAGSLGALFYAVVGVDFYQYNYIELFYCVVPAIIVGGGVALLLQRFSAEHRSEAKLVVGATAVIMLCAWTAIPPIYATQYNWPADVVDAHLQAVETGPVVVDLPTGDDWAMIEAQMLAVEAYRVRHGRPRFCIGANWHGVFTEKLRCTPDELATERHISVDIASATLPADAKRLTEAVGLVFFSQDDKDVSGTQP